MKKTIVLGASLKPDRYSNQAVRKLRVNNIETIALGFENGTIADVTVETDWKNYTDIHTISLYLNTSRQEQYYEYILAQQPKRIIFNPGTENPTLQQLAQAKNIETLEACTLVLLSIGSY